MKRKKYLFFIALTAIGLVAYFTNPTPQMHQEAAKEKLYKVADNLLATYGIGSGFFSKMGVDLSEKIVDELIRHHVSSGNYFLFSTTQVNWNGQSQIIGVGAFNKVFISNKAGDIMQKELEKFIQEKIKSIKIPGMDIDLGF